MRTRTKMAEVNKGSSSKLLKVSTCISKCKVQISNATNRRNRKRALTRKKRKLKYVEKVRKLTEKRSQSLQSALSTVFDITDMNAKGNITQERSLKPPQEVADWQYHHQLAYWKSRAISLEYENRMLHAYIKKMSTQEIQDYIDYVKEGNETNVSGSEYETLDNLGGSSDNNRGELTKLTNKKVLYGDTESKINAMETAMKVNYNLHLERHTPQLWPNISLNL